jgi:hypothetical protein
MRSDSFSACPSVRSHLAVGLVLAFAPLAGWAAPLKHAGEPVKVTLAKISDRTLEVRLQKAGEETFASPLMPPRRGFRGKSCGRAPI